MPVSGAEIKTVLMGSPWSLESEGSSWLNEPWADPPQPQHLARERPQLVEQRGSLQRRKQTQEKLWDKYDGSEIGASQVRARAKPSTSHADPRITGAWLDIHGAYIPIVKMEWENYNVQLATTTRVAISMEEMQLQLMLQTAKFHDSKALKWLGSQLVFKKHLHCWQAHLCDLQDLKSATIDTWLMLPPPASARTSTSTSGTY